MAASKNIAGQAAGAGEQRRAFFRRPALRAAAVLVSLGCFAWLVWYAYGDGAAHLHASTVPVLAPPENQKQKTESASANTSRGKAGDDRTKRRIFRVMERPEKALFEVLTPSGTKSKASASAKKTADKTAKKTTKATIKEVAKAPVKETGKKRAGAVGGAGKPAEKTKPEKKSGQKIAKTGTGGKGTSTTQAKVHFVQLAALGLRSKAETGAQRLAKKHAGVIGGAPVQVRRAVIPGVGEIFRVVIGPYSDRAKARGVCTALNKRQQDCFIASYN